MPELGSWGGELGNSGNAQKKTFFSIDPFPYYILLHQNEISKQEEKMRSSTMFTYNCSGDCQSNRPHGLKFQIVIEFAKCAIFQSSPTICSIGVKGVREETDKVQRERGSNRGKKVSMMHCTVKLNCIGSRNVGILFCVDSRPPCYSKIIEMTNIIR